MMIKTPTLIQMENAECGAVCLGIILGTYNRFVPMEILRYQCGVSRNGCDAFNLIEAARLQGLETEAYHAEFEELTGLKLPAIVWWEKNHFVVLEGMNGKDIYINDPATGRRVVSREEFHKNYSKVIILLQPSSHFKPGGNKETFIFLLKERLSPIIVPLALVASIQLCLVWIGLASPAFSQVFLDQIMINRVVGWIFPLLFVMSLFSLLALGFITLERHVLKKLSNKLTIQNAKQYLWHLLHLPVVFFYQRYGGEVIQRLGLNISVTETLAGQLTATVLNLIFIGFYAFVMFAYNIPITILGIATAILNLISLWWVTEARKNAYARVKQQQARFSGVMTDTLQNIDTIKSTGTESFFLNRIVGLMTQNLNAGQAIALKDIWLTTATSFAQSLAGLILLGFGIMLIMEGQFTVGMLIAFQMLLSRFLGPVNHFVGLGTLMQTLKIDMQRLNDVLRNPIDKSFASLNALPLQDIKGRLELRNVKFGYAPLDEPLFNHFDLIIPEGKRVALVGPTGSGKTTLALLASGLFELFEGAILIDGIDIKSIPKKQLAKIMAQVSQELFLFEGTVRENLSLWDETIPSENLWAALEDACLKDDILLREGGLNAKVLPGGRNFSEGQRQRLEIARSLVNDPKILILDEATSALDSETEACVMNNLLKRKCTCLIITHRLSTIKNCDEIFVLEKGEIIQRGGHQYLSEHEGLYKKLLICESFR